VLLTLRADDRVRVRLEGPLLWTHFGASGPAVLNMSRHWHRAQLDGQAMQVAVNVCPDDTFESLERWFLDQERERPRAQVSTVLAGRLPAAVADVWIASAHVEPIITLAHLTREERRRLIHALLDTPLDVRDSLRSRTACRGRSFQRTDSKDPKYRRWLPYARRHRRRDTPP